MYEQRRLIQCPIWNTDINKLSSVPVNACDMHRLIAVAIIPAQRRTVAPLNEELVQILSQQNVAPAEVRYHQRCRIMCGILNNEKKKTKHNYFYSSFII